ncbi:MAG: ribosome biogenesis GTPase YlqF [Oscillospiraceae bacterium]|nr:ribosome biogenesis GTPase YlqF [Oscillospiraceae bacterium]
MQESPDEKINISWFPGHMAKARRMLEENIKLVDAVCEIADARIPLSSRNPDLAGLTAAKPRLLIFNRADLADPNITANWREYFKGNKEPFIETDSKSGAGISGFPRAVRELLKEKLNKSASKGLRPPVLRVMVVGITNVGKSSFINRAAKRKAAPAADRPGVTRGKQWITVDSGLELLDTPGLLWPKFDDPETGELLAITGAIPNEMTDAAELAAGFMARLKKYYPEAIKSRYDFIPEDNDSGHELLQKAAKRRAFLMPGGDYDIERMAYVLFDEFRAGKLGRISLERPDIRTK